MTSPRPTEVAVFGNSAGVLVAGTHGAEPPYLTYPAALGRARVGDVTFNVHNYCRITSIITEAAGAWLYPLSQQRPDIVVLQYGAYEAFPRTMPRRLTRYLMGTRRHAGRVRAIAWHRAARLLGALAAAAARLDSNIPVAYGGHLTTRRFENELRHICRRIRHQTGARVVLMDSYLPVSGTLSVTDKMLQRTRSNNEIIYRVADDMDLEVFPFEKLVEGFGPDRVLGDGLHMDANTHRAVGEHLAQFLARGAI